MNLGNELVQNFRSEMLKDSVLPLARDRQPLSMYSDTALLRYANFVIDTPELIGRCAEIIRKHVPISGTREIADTPNTYLEAHINISETDQKIKNNLLALGFERDDFWTPYPVDYSECFTLRTAFPSYANRSSEIRDLIRKQVCLAQTLIESYPYLSAYWEIETYGFDNRFEQEFRLPSPSSLSSFPFQKGRFQYATEVLKKTADLHVKLPNNKAFPDEDIFNEPMRCIRQLLRSAGFYEIRSLSGRDIYSIPIDRSSSGKRAFEEIVRWSKQNGGVIGIDFEICLDMWRRPSSLLGKEWLSPVPQCVTDTNFK